MSSSVDVVVLGAGPAGLAAAWRAARRGFSVRVLDRADHVGGMSSSFEVAGVRVDLGSHRLHPATPPRVMQDLQTLLGEDLQTRQRSGRLRIGGTWVSFPLKAGELTRRLPAAMTAGIARDAMTGPMRRARHDTYAEQLRAGIGPTVYNALYGPYAQKLWGLPGDEISGQQARKRVTGNSVWKVAGRMLRGGGTSGSSGQGRVFHYPRRGFGQICDRLADGAVEAGAEIHLGAEVDQLNPSYDDVRVQSVDGGVTQAGIALSTLPMPLLARITSPGPSLAAMEAATRLRFRAMVLVYVVHKGGRWTPYDAHYLPAGDTPVTRISEPANYRESADDPTDVSVICAEIPCAVDDDIWTADDESLAMVVEEAVDRADLPPLARAEVVVRRLPFVYPVYEIGYERRLAGIEAWVTGIPQIVTFGRLGLFAHDNSHHAMLEAYEAVDCLGLDGRFDLARWRIQRAKFAEHVVED
ncbi:MAG: FAD-dependent oxidoreductase [Propionibacteriales bacterium]|nr:FAD-dependent oxidoreductase [Propionibacteriales bacterium]